MSTDNLTRPPLPVVRIYIGTADARPDAGEVNKTLESMGSRYRAGLGVLGTHIYHLLTNQILAADQEGYVNVPDAIVPDVIVGYRKLVKGDKVKKDDVFLTEDGTLYRIGKNGYLLGVRCVGQEIRKDDGGFWRQVEATEGV